MRTGISSHSLPRVVQVTDTQGLNLTVKAALSRCTVRHVGQVPIYAKAKAVSEAVAEVSETDDEMPPLISADERPIILREPVVEVVCSSA